MCSSESDHSFEMENTQNALEQIEHVSPNNTSSDEDVYVEDIYVEDIDPNPIKLSDLFEDIRSHFDEKTIAKMKSKNIDPLRMLNRKQKIRLKNIKEQTKNINKLIDNNKQMNVVYRSFEKQIRKLGRTLIAFIKRLIEIEDNYCETNVMIKLTEKLNEIRLLFMESDANFFIIQERFESIFVYFKMLRPVIDASIKHQASMISELEKERRERNILERCEEIKNLTISDQDNLKDATLEEKVGSLREDRKILVFTACMLNFLSEKQVEEAIEKHLEEYSIDGPE
ncbi:hypothetical protein TBLA_0G02650 [Henningerozyma blattae CBS 6284]|uniref:Uncharacterized protein n=1 Tax=Henningerozyma blattae (strain ATCC 34711 / CBS 6284 / DSM 70876 / NBRC 10599 / NRRL Y-10934 / UCD 77-7) TaxID=1071380 RepID=I2H751_HENB6|nr:hypothetical protein TBLA_0G02650 [Tetrapisispora blattae CBS 6284]CCH62203.1 hypothetical protein TBLA_0G02650 [Tetrapisispora blattae CBS 6284]